MTRSMKLAALAGALAVLTVGPGCGTFGGLCDDCDNCDDVSHSTEYQRDGLPTPRDAGAPQSVDFTPGAAAPTGPGVHLDNVPK